MYRTHSFRRGISIFTEIRWREDPLTRKSSRRFEWPAAGYVGAILPGLPPGRAVYVADFIDNEAWYVVPADSFPREDEPATALRWFRSGGGGVVANTYCPIYAPSENSRVSPWVSVKHYYDSSTGPDRCGHAVVAVQRILLDDFELFAPVVFGSPAYTRQRQWVDGHVMRCWEAIPPATQARVAEFVADNSDVLSRLGMEGVVAFLAGMYRPVRGMGLTRRA